MSVSKVNTTIVKSMKIECDGCHKKMGLDDPIYCDCCHSSSFNEGEESGRRDHVERVGILSEETQKEFAKFLRAMGISNECPIGVLVRVLPNDDARKSIVRLADMILREIGRKGN